VSQRLDNRSRVCLAVLALLLAMQIKWWWEPTPDGSAYLSIAKHMSEGRLARFDSPHLKYAPGYPMVVAPAFWISDKPFLAISLIHWGLAVGLLAGVFVWFRRLVGPKAALPTTALVMLNVGLWSIYRQTLSELAFMMGLMWSVYGLARLAECPTRRGTAIWTACSIVMLIFTCYVRQVGVFLIGGFAMAMAVRAYRRDQDWRRAAGITAAVGCPVLVALAALVGWDHRMAAVAGGDAKSYHQYMVAEGVTASVQVAEGIRLRISEFGRLLIPGMHKAYANTGEWLHYNTILYAAVAVVLAGCWWTQCRRTNDALLWMVPIYVAFFATWPFDQGTRYMVPLLPALVLCLWTALERVNVRQGTVICLIALHACVAVGEWIRDVEYRDSNQIWGQLAELTEPMSDDGGELGIGRVDVDLYAMLLLETDRLPQSPRGERVLAARFPVWLIFPIEEAIPEGYTERRRIGALQLLQLNHEKPQTVTLGN